MSNDYRVEGGIKDQLPQRKNMRLWTHDYSSAGRYFVTICTKYHAQWLGDINDGKMKASTS